MTSKQKRAIAQQNGAKAAGAKSPQGIQTSSRNATRHGLFSKVLVLSNESQANFDELLQMYLEKFHPTDGVETNLVYEMVAAKWRQQRVWLIETTALEVEMGDQQIDLDEHAAKGGEKISMTAAEQIAMGYSKIANNEKTLELLLRYETSYSRMHDHAIKELFRLREKCNLRNDPNPPETANTQPVSPESTPPEPTVLHRQSPEPSCSSGKPPDSGPTIRVKPGPILILERAVPDLK